MSAQALRALQPEEIKQLESNGCRCDNWAGIQITDATDCSKIISTAFSGSVSIGSNKGSIIGKDGITRNCSITNAQLSNVAVGNECSITNVGGWLSQLNIAERVIIEDVGSILCTGETTFGNGHMISVLNEGGGRELPITAMTSAQTAYLTVMYRDRKKLIDALYAIANKYGDQVKSNKATIGASAQIYRCQTIENVCIGPCAVVDGATSLKEGTIDSSEEARSLVGDGVIAKEFIVQKGASVTDGAMAYSSLVGEGSKMGKQFSSENAAFFANSEAFHSEACSVFAGPYSVTHHRSTLLIAIQCSFYNAGSGTNQSNHMYKLGPLHQGILERGCKTGSFSYLLWPSRVGAFTAIIGKHYANFDTTEFPFSYINEEKGKSTLVPGMNFFTVGTLRDMAKWPNRDRRTAKRKLDCIIFDVLSPYTAAKMDAGQAILAELGAKAKADADRTGVKAEWVTYKGITIKRLLLKTCTRYYGLILDKYFGDVLVKRMEAVKPSKLADMLAYSDNSPQTTEEWIDMCGLLCRKSRMETLCADIEKGTIASMEDLQCAIEAIHAGYADDEWNWFLAQFKQKNGAELAESPKELQKMIDAWKIASNKLITMVLNDGEKEFDEATRLGFGVDGNRDADFEAVRGTFKDNSFVQQLKQQQETIEQKHKEMLSLIA